MSDKALGETLHAIIRVNALIIDLLFQEGVLDKKKTIASLVALRDTTNSVTKAVVVDKFLKILQRQTGTGKKRSVH